MDRVLYSVPVATPDGEFGATYSALGLCGLTFPVSQPAATLSPDRDRRRARPCSGGTALLELPPRIRNWHAELTEALAKALAGREPRPLPPFDLSRGTHFQRAVWQVLRTIKRGGTMSYGEVAKALGRPGASRAVGSACGANPIPVLIPCHRVLGAGGKIGGFSADPRWKLLLLERERADWRGAQGAGWQA
jgi:methylated-DNA-[protein]-cysteine S-methyltransferase